MSRLRIYIEVGQKGYQTDTNPTNGDEPAEKELFVSVEIVTGDSGDPKVHLFNKFCFIHTVTTEEWGGVTNQYPRSFNPTIMKGNGGSIGSSCTCIRAHIYPYYLQLLNPDFTFQGHWVNARKT